MITSKDLSSFCKSHSSFKTRLGILSLYQARFSNWFEILLLSFEYLQLLSLTILIHPTAYSLSNANTQESYIFEVVAYFFKLANPSYLLSFSGSNSTTNAVLAIILGLTLLKAILMYYVLYASYSNQEVRKPIKDLWRLIFKLQGRVICCFITSFWVRTIVMTSSEPSFSIQGISNRALIAVSAVLIVLEYLISFILETQLCDFIPSKRYLASKNFDMQILTLFQKFLIQIIQLFAYKDLTGCLWASIILNLLISFTRELRFFTTLPFYNSKPLFYQGDLIAIALALHLVHFFQRILISSSYSQETDLRFIIISWVVVGLLCWRLSRALLENIFVKLLTSNSSHRKNPQLLLHKIFATKHLVRNITVPTKRNIKSDIKYLIGATESLNILKVFNLKPKLSRLQSSGSGGLTNKQEIKAIFLEYLEDLANRFPNDSLVKLIQAHRNYKSLKFHSKILKIVSRLNKANIFSPYYTSSALLFHDLEITAKLHHNSPLQEHQKTLNLISYIKNQLLMEDLEKQILKEIDLRKQICSHLLQETSDIETIYQNSQTINRAKTSISKKMHHLLNNISDHYLRPLAVLAEYNLLLNYSVQEYRKFYGYYCRKSIKFTKELESPDLCDENLYQDTNAFLIISADKLESGSITYSTRSLQDICGFDQTNYQNTDITKIFPPSLRTHYSKIFKEIFEKGQNDFSNKMVRAYLYHKEGYLVDTDIFIRVHPYVSQNLYLDMLIRPRFSYENAILVDQTGKIESATQGIIQFLKIEKTSKSALNLNLNLNLNIKQISPELANLNSAFNLIKHRKENNFGQNSRSSNEAEELYNLYMTENKFIELSPFSTGTPLPKTSFKCKISILDSSASFYHIIKLTKFAHSINNKIQNEDDSPATLSSSSESSSESSLDFQEREQVKEIPSFHCLNTMTSDRMKTPTNNLLTPTQEQLLLTKTNNTQYNETEENLMLSPTSSRAFLKTNNNSSRPRRVTFNLPDVKTPKMQDNQDPPVFKSTMSVTTHQSEISHISDVFRTFERAITLKTYKKSFSFLCLIFYGVILLTLAAEIALKNVLDDTMNHLIIKTDLLNYAQLRTYQTCRMHNIARGSILQIAGVVTDTDLNVPNKQLQGNLDTMLSALTVLLQANDGILNNINNENDEIKQMLFQKDINITGNALDPTDPKYQLITSFQQVDIVTQALMVLKSLTTLISTAATRTFTFLANNLPNDFLAKNEEIIEVFLASVKQQKDNLQIAINLSVIVLPILLAGIVVLLSLIIWKQYQKEKENLLAFLKLNPLMIQHILENLKTFQRKLARLEDFTEELRPTVLYRLEYSSQFSSGYHKNQDLKTINSMNMKKRYIGYVLQILLYISILIIIVIVNYALITKATKEIYRKQGQIQYANDISMTVSITFISEIDSFVTNNTNYIMRQRPFDLFKTGIQDVAQIQTNIYKEFQDENGEYDPEVKTLIFEEISCDRFTAGPYTFCNSLISLGQTMKMVSILTLYKNMLDNKYVQYLAVNKSSFATMIAVATTQVSYLQASSAVTSAYAQLISQAIGKKLAASVDDIYDLGTAILIVFSLSLVVVSLLIWFQVLTKVKEVNNNFKKVLAVFPPNIILSSFLLKSFLNQTSGIKQKL